MIRGGLGGGNTITGLNFERTTDINALLNSTPGYSVTGNVILHKGKEVARSYKKHGLYMFLSGQGINYKNYIKKITSG